MGTCFLDIFPHINSNYEKFRANANWEVDYPFPEFFVCCGFFLVYLLEELTLKVFSSPFGHSHGRTNGHFSSKDIGSTKARDPNGNRKGSTPIMNGHCKSLENCAEEEGRYSKSERKVSVLTHEMVMDESLKYVISDDPESGLLKSLTFAVAMSFHSIMEGFALGVQDGTTGIVTLFISLLIHKGIEAFSVGLQISKSNSNRIVMVTLTVIVYALMTPFGSLIGVLVTNLNINELLKEGIVIVFESLAGGTFIYVTFFEVLAQERANDHSNLIQLNAIVIGFLVISALQLNEHFTEVHGHH